jgi:Glycosyltransferase family 87
LHLLFLATLSERIKRGYPDFSAFYTAGMILRHGLGHQLYSEQLQFEMQKSFAGHLSSGQRPLPYIHPPFEALIFVPLTLFGYLDGFLVWNLSALVVLVCVAWLLRRSVGTLRVIPAWEFVFASLAFFPVFACFLEGQDSILLLLICTLGFNALKRRANFLAGCWFALGTFKFQWMVPIVMLLMIWRMRRVAAGFAVVSAVLGLVSLGLVGWQSLVHYPSYALRIVQTPGLGGVASELMPNLRGLLLGWRLPFSAAAGNGLVALSSMLLFVFAAIRGRKASQPKSLELQFSLAVTVSGLIGWHTNAHDLTLLLLPLVLILDYCFGAQAGEPAKRFALLLPTLPLLVSPLWIVLWLASGKVNLMAAPLLWWCWKIGNELPRDRHSLYEVQSVPV